MSFIIVYGEQKKEPYERVQITLTTIEELEKDNFFI